MFKLISGFIKLSVVVFLIYYVGNPAYQTYQKTRDVVLALQDPLIKAQKTLSGIVNNISTGGDPKIPEAEININLIKAKLKKVSELKVMELSGTIRVNTLVNGSNKDFWKDLPFVGSPNSGQISFENKVEISGHVVFDLSKVIIKQENAKLLVILPAPAILMSPLAWQTEASNNGTISEADRIKLSVLQTLSKRENDSYFYDLFFRNKATSLETVDKITNKAGKNSLKQLLTPIVPENTEISIIVDSPTQIISGYYTQKGINSVFNPFGLSDLTSAGLNSQIKRALFGNSEKAVVSIVPSVSSTSLRSTQSDTNPKQP